MTTNYPMDVQRRVEQRWVRHMKLASPDAQGSMVFARPASQQPNQVRQGEGNAGPSPSPAPLGVRNSAIMDEKTVGAPE